LLPGGDGHTPLDDDERRGLKLSYVSTRGELNEAEQAGILDAVGRRPPPVDELLDDRYLRRLHQTMFGRVWTWAGRYRRTETNIGVAPAEIAVAVRLLVDDARAWVADGPAPAAADDAAVRFHHRLVSIHPFPNGNGRHSRLAADYLALGVGRPRFGWGLGSAGSADEQRRRYLDALRCADRGDLAPLVAFARGDGTTPRS